MHVSRSHMRFWARNPNTSNGRTVSAESSEIQRHRWVKQITIIICLHLHFSVICCTPKHQSAASASTAGPAAQTRCYKQRAPHAERIEVSCTETPLHFTGPPQFTSGDSRQLHVYCMLQLRACGADCGFTSGNVSGGKSREGFSKFHLESPRNVMRKIDTRMAAV